MQQEGTETLGLPVDHLAGEVIGDVAVVAGEAIKERVRIVASTQRERREL